MTKHPLSTDSGHSICSICGVPVVDSLARVAATRLANGRPVVVAVKVTVEPCGHSVTLPRG